MDAHFSEFLYSIMVQVLSLLCQYSKNANDDLPEIITYESLQSLSYGCLFLEELSMNYFILSAHCVSYLINNSDNLKELSLMDCGICDDGFMITKNDNQLINLKLLDIKINYNITNERFLQLIKGCISLESIQISSCIKLTDTSLFHIAENCPNLEEIDVEDDPNITSASLNMLVKKCLKLTSISTESEKMTTTINNCNLLKYNLRT